MTKLRAGKVLAALVIAAAALIFYQLVYRGDGHSEARLSYAELSAKIQDKQVKRAQISEDRIKGELTNGQTFRAEVSNPVQQSDVVEALRSSDASITFVQSDKQGLFALLNGLTTGVVPAVLVLVVSALLLAFWVWMIIDCALKEPAGPDKIVWILIILLANALGAAIYFVVRRNGRRASPLSASS